MTEIIDLNQPAKATWDAFVERSPQGILYCKSWWLDAVAPGRYELLTVSSGSEIRAGWPIVWAEVGRHHRVVMPPLTQKLGILFSPSAAKYAEELSNEHRLMDELISKLPPNTYVYMHCHENFTNWLPFCWHGFRQTTRYTYVLEDLSDLECIWEEMRGTARKEVRKAEKLGIRCRETEDLSLFYELNNRIFHRQGLDTPYSFEFLKRIDDACLKNAHRKIMIAEDVEGRPHAFRYFMYDEQCTLLVAGGADDNLRGSGACSLLDWEIIKFASTVSKRFDFTGSMMRGIEPYIRTFGAKRKQYFCIWGSANWGSKTKSTQSSLRQWAGRALRKAARIIDP